MSEQQNEKNEKNEQKVVMGRQKSFLFNSSYYPIYALVISAAFSKPVAVYGQISVVWLTVISYCPLLFGLLLGDVFARKVTDSEGDEKDCLPIDFFRFIQVAFPRVACIFAPLALVHFAVLKIIK